MTVVRGDKDIIIKDGTLLHMQYKNDFTPANCYICAGFKVRMREGPRSLQKLFDMVPSPVPLTGTSTASINHHPDNRNVHI